MALYRRSRQEFISQLVSLFFCLSTAGLILFFSDEYFWPWAVLAGSFFVLLAVFFLFRLLMALERVEFVDDSDRGVLLVRRLFQKRAHRLESVTGVKVFPSWGKTVLFSGKKRLTLHHQLMRYESLFVQIGKARPDLFVTEEGPLILKTSRVGPALLAFFSLVIAGAGLVLSLLNPFILFPALLFAVLPLGRLAWFTPLSFKVASGTLEVRYLLRKKTLAGTTLKEVKEDVYAASGCTFFVMVLAFSQGSVILDEGQLLNPVRPHAPWIKTSLFPPVL